MTSVPNPFEHWTVLPHGKLTQVDDGLLTVVGQLHMPVGDFPRRMTVARLGRHGEDRPKLVIYSAIALDEDEMVALEQYGTPAFLVVPSDIHRMDARTWKERYPNLYVVAPAAAREKVEEVVHVDACAVDFGDPHVRYVEVLGTGQHESALVVERPAGTTLVVNDVIWNVDHRPGVRGWLMKIAGFTGPEPRIPPLVARKAIHDKRTFCDQLETWARIPKLRRIIPSHGDVIERAPNATLHELAVQLAA